jgi:hypothetical protein
MRRYLDPFRGLETVFAVRFSPGSITNVSDSRQVQLLHTRTGVIDITSIARTSQSELTTRLLACRGDILLEVGRRPSSRRESISARGMAMDLRYVSDGLHLDRKDLFGREAPVPWRPSTDSQPLFLVDTGDNSAGNGGDGYFAGSLIDKSYAAFGPLNMAQAGTHATANAHQTNIGIFDQSATQTAGTGGDGGDWNAAMGGSVGVFGLIGSDAIATGDNSAGNGGDGHFSGALVHAPVAVFDPINMAAAGFHGTADAHQSNTVQFLQGASQAAGGGGHGGNDNAASGGAVSVFAAGAPGHYSHASDHNWINSDLIASGGNHAGDGGDGYFYGSIVHASFALYNPINIAVAGYNSDAHADQTNNVIFDQSAFQMAGIGGNGGSGNAAAGGGVSVSGSQHGAGYNWINSDLIASGGNHAGDGGDGYFYGGIVHASFALYNPINIAVAGYNSSAHADQTNNVIFDQSAFQMAGVGGNGGNGNAAIGGDAGLHSSILGLIGSDVIATGGNSAGSGGDGHFAGSLIDLNIAIYAPINIAVAGPNSTADAHQTNNVQFDQSAIQIAGIGGDGGHGNAAFGGDFAMHVLADDHLLGHA